MEGRVCKSTGFFNCCYRVRGVDSEVALSKGKWSGWWS